MRRETLLVVLAAVATACEGMVAGSDPGALRVHGVEGEGQLHLDAVDRGPVQSVQLFAGLAAGEHVIDLRRDGEVVARHAVEVRSGMLLDVRIDAPFPAAIPTIAHATPAAPVPRTDPLVTTPVLPPRATTAPPENSAPETDAPPAGTAPEDITATGTTPERARAPFDRAASAPPRGREPSHGADLDPLLARALEEGSSAPAAQDQWAREREREREELAAATAALPEQPSRAAVVVAVQSIMPDISRCAASDHGTAVIIFEIDGDTGRARHATVRGQYAGTPIGTCIEAIARTAEFGEFRRSSFAVSYPVRF
ncbi:MAG: hypothetical protein M3Y87_34630 [Myxococcota bacterium]|nr:hypothetical protein [Myxococcota bacterium]